MILLYCIAIQFPVEQSIFSLFLTSHHYTSIPGDLGSSYTLNSEKKDAP